MPVIRSRTSLVLLVIGVLIFAGTTADATVSSPQTSGKAYYACAKPGRPLTLTTRKAKCPKKTKKIVWNQQGRVGARGAAGPQGAPGVAGERGATGAQGIPGAQGIQGIQGPSGVSNHTSGQKTMTLATPGVASLFSIHLAGKETAGGTVDYTITADDGGSQVATEHGRIQWLATANSVTCTVQTTDKLHLGTVNSGCTPGFFNPGSQPGVSIFDNVSFSSPAPIVHHQVVFTIVNDSSATLRLEP